MKLSDSWHNIFRSEDVSPNRNEEKVCRVPHITLLSVQSHDMLSTLSRDILYTSALAQRAQRSLGWRGRRWTYRISGCGLWWRRVGMRSRWVLCALSLASHVRPGRCGFGDTPKLDWRGSVSAADGPATRPHRRRGSRKNESSRCAWSIRTGALASWRCC
jgi:hypothetical protein